MLIFEIRLFSLCLLSLFFRVHPLFLFRGLFYDWLDRWICDFYSLFSFLFVLFLFLLQFFRRVYPEVDYIIFVFEWDVLSLYANLSSFVLFELSLVLFALEWIYRHFAWIFSTIFLLRLFVLLLFFSFLLLLYYLFLLLLLFLPLRFFLPPFSLRFFLPPFFLHLLFLALLFLLYFLFLHFLDFVEIVLCFVEEILRFGGIGIPRLVYFRDLIRYFPL